MMPQNFEEAGRKVDSTLKDAAEKVEAEVKRAITYLNDEVVPNVRVHSSRGLREAAEQLRKLADQLDTHGRGR
jgi:F0F1-type ATP synthase membrane subunit b/b'